MLSIDFTRQEIEPHSFFSFKGLAFPGLLQCFDSGLLFYLRHPKPRFYFHSLLAQSFSIRLKDLQKRERLLNFWFAMPAQRAVQHKPQSLIGRQIVGWVNLDEKNRAGFLTRFLLAGYADEGALSASLQRAQRLSLHLLANIMA
ncbi:MAG: hypothetical protein K0S07_366 [Chlamydiales bacterium]|jgi:hypothetical protein|nr:hypothetical protein [Chlamydiales bacterium]